MGSRRTTVVVAAALVVAGLGAFLVWRSDEASDRRRRELREQVAVEVPGARLVRESWRDEEHGRYIDVGGYNHRAGWTLAYELGEPVAVAVVADAYVAALQPDGWSVIDRRDGHGRLTLHHGPAGRQRRVELEIVVEDAVASRYDIGDSLLPGGATPTTRRFTVRIELPYEEEPRYPT